MEADAARVAFDHKRLVLLGYLQGAQIEPPLLERAHAWLTHSWAAQGGARAADVIDTLPPPLRVAIRTEVIHNTTRASPLFEPLWASRRKSLIGGGCAAPPGDTPADVRAETGARTRKRGPTAERRATRVRVEIRRTVARQGA